jgi:hypothetical protein
MNPISMNIRAFREQSLPQRCFSGRRSYADDHGLGGQYTHNGHHTNEFAKVSWFRNDLLPYHINDYINLMVDAPKAYLVSSNLREKYKLKEGDTIHISWGDQNYLEGVVYAFVDYWPTYNPNPVAKGKDAPD